MLAKKWCYSENSNKELPSRNARSPVQEINKENTCSCAEPTPSKSMIGLEGLPCGLRACHKVFGVQKGIEQEA